MANHRRVLGPSRKLNLTGHVGFDSLPDQRVNRCVSAGFTFNCMIVGEAGLGKSTLIESLFKLNAPEDDETKFISEDEGVSILSSSYNLEENGVALKLNVLETRGFGHQINKSDSHRPIIDFIDSAYDAYLFSETKSTRMGQKIDDKRVHACIYCISPTGHSLKSFDVVCMKDLASRVNLIPVIMKADTITKSDLVDFKARILKEMKNSDIAFYELPIEDETTAQNNRDLSEFIPFAVVGSRNLVKVGNQQIRARQYPWGIVEVENAEHGDFIKLREAMLRVNLQNLIETTQSQHYEAHRSVKLATMGDEDNDHDEKPISLQTNLERRQASWRSQVEQREQEMRMVFVEKVKKKESELRKNEQDLAARFKSENSALEEQIAAVQSKTRSVKEELAELATVSSPSTKKKKAGRSGIF